MLVVEDDLDGRVEQDISEKKMDYKRHTCIQWIRHTFNSSTVLVKYGAKLDLIALAKICITDISHNSHVTYQQHQLH